MITVAGEALVDLITDPGGLLDPRLGGGPFNVVRAVARLGVPAAFLGRLSDDRFGRLQRAELDRHQVLAVLPEAAAEPTTLAVVDVDAAGVPGYRFYLTGTAAAAIEPGRAQLAPGTTALHVGTLGLIMEPIGTSLEKLVTELSDDVLLMLDPNCRPGAIASRSAYLERIDRMLRRADLVKVSIEDLDYLLPGYDAARGAADLLGRGPSCVLVTDGADPVRAFTRAGEVRAEVPQIPVVDTVGAGDAFGGAFLVWWTGHGFGRAELAQAGHVGDAARAAVYASAVNCTRRGAEPPWAAELAGHEGWTWLKTSSS